MRALLLFGEFRLIRNIPLGKEYQPIRLIHPLSSKTLSWRIDQPLTAIEPLKYMTFEYAKQLDADLLQYEFVEES